MWEIDSPGYYQFIGWNGSQDDDSYWLNHSLNEATVPLLKNLLNELKTRTQMC